MDASAPHQQPERWHLKKEVNISIIAAIIAQCVLFGVAWGNMENRVATLEATARDMRSVPERLASIDATLIAIKERLDREARH